MTRPTPAISSSRPAAIPRTTGPCTTSSATTSLRDTGRARSVGYLPGCDYTDFAVTPGGKRVVLACAGGTTAQTVDTTTLAQDAQYATGEDPVAVAVGPDGSVAAGAYQVIAPPVPADVSVHRAGGTAPESTYKIDYYIEGLGFLPRPLATCSPVLRQLVRRAAYRLGK